MPTNIYTGMLVSGMYCSSRNQCSARSTINYGENLFVLYEPHTETRSTRSENVPEVKDWFPDSRCTGMLMDGDQLIKYTDPDRIHATERSVRVILFILLMLKLSCVLNPGYTPLHVRVDDNLLGRWHAVPPYCVR